MKNIKLKKNLISLNGYLRRFDELDKKTNQPSSFRFNANIFLKTKFPLGKAKKFKVEHHEMKAASHCLTQKLEEGIKLQTSSLASLC